LPEVEYATTAKLPVEVIWDFVQEMDNWATFVAGYQSHEKQSEKDSTWVLKGDVGMLARTVKFAVHI
jgi:carbon monoxide dehydrogenase subunit G